MTRAATSPEITKLASDGQASVLHAHIITPPVVFAARVNQAFAVATRDKLREIKFDGVTTGAYTALVTGMTVWIGSAAGLSDHGIACVRKSATSTKLFIIETSELIVSDNDYITVYYEFFPFAKHPLVASGGTTYINYSEKYTDQHLKPKPVIVAGGDRVLPLRNYWLMDGSRPWAAHGNASRDTSVKHDGAASLGLDGSGDYIDITSADFAIGTANFELSAWVRTTSLAAKQTIFDFLIPGGNGYRGDSVIFSIDTSGHLCLFSIGAPRDASTGTISINTWTKVGVRRVGTTWTYSINGVDDPTTVSLTVNITSGGATIGKASNASSEYFSGNIDTVLLTVGGAPVSSLTFDGADVSATTTFDLSASYVPDNSTVASYLTTCSTATITDETTDAPILTTATFGDHIVKFTVTSEDGKASTTYRTVSVVGPTDTNVILDDNSGDATGWSAGVTMYESTAAIHDREKVIIYADDYYGGSLGSIGSLAGCENVVFVGWIDGKTLTYDEIGGGVSFTVKSAAWWLGQIKATTEVKLSYTTGTPSNWGETQGLGVDRFLWHIFENYSTCLLSMDLIRTLDDRATASITAPIGTLWDQTNGVLDSKIKGNLFCNQYGQLITRIDIPLIPIASRSGIPSVVTLTADDFADVTVDIVQVNPDAQVVITGSLVNGAVICALGGGHIPDHIGGDGPSIDGLLASSQGQLNVLAGSLLERDNCPYHFSISNLCGNNRLIEPGDRLTLTLTAADNLAGLDYDAYIIVRSVNRSHDPETGGWVISLEADAETQALRYATGDVEVPDEPDSDVPSTYVPFPSHPPLGFTPLDPTDPIPDPPDPGDCISTSPPTGPYTLTWSNTFLDGDPDAPERQISTAAKLCTIREAGADNPTSLTFMFRNRGQAYAHLHCYATGATGEEIATGSVSVESFDGGEVYTATVTFSEAGAITVYGFKLTLDAGYDLVNEGEILLMSYDDTGNNADLGANTLIDLDTSFAEFSQSTFIHHKDLLPGYWYQARVNMKFLTPNTKVWLYGYIEYFFGEGACTIIDYDEPQARAQGPFKILLIEDTGTDTTATWLIQIRSDWVSAPDPEDLGIFCHFMIYASAEVPMRSAALSPGELSNVCPPGVI